MMLSNLILEHIFARLPKSPIAIKFSVAISRRELEGLENWYWERSIVPSPPFFMGC